MKQTIIVGLFAVLFGVGFAAFYDKVRAQALVGPNPYPRFWMSDYSVIGGDEKYSAFILHDNKFREVCFLVVAPTYGDGRGVAMTPRQC